MTKANIDERKKMNSLSIELIHNILQVLLLHDGCLADMPDNIFLYAYALYKSAWVEMLNMQLDQPDIEIPKQIGDKLIAISATYNNEWLRRVNTLHTLYGPSISKALSELNRRESL